MFQNSSIFVIVPAFNEASVIRRIILSLLSRGFSVVVVDDGSTDDTREVLSDLGVFFIRHDINLGQGAALQTGMDFAKQKDAEVVVHFDADGQHQAEDILTLVALIREGECDIALGSRFLRRSDENSIPFVRRVVLRGARLINWLFSGLLLSDAHNGLRAMNSKALNLIALRENRHAHASEILVQIRKHNLRFAEVPISVVYNEYSRAKGQSSWNAINIVFDLFLRRVFR